MKIYIQESACYTLLNNWDMFDLNAIKIKPVKIKPLNRVPKELIYLGMVNNFTLTNIHQLLYLWHEMPRELELRSSLVFKINIPKVCLVHKYHKYHYARVKDLLFDGKSFFVITSKGNRRDFYFCSEESMIARLEGDL